MEVKLVLSGKSAGMQERMGRQKIMFFCAKWGGSQGEKLSL